jgi:hypothetical protein
VNVADASATTSPSATLWKLSRQSRAEYTLPLSNASCRSWRSHARLRAYALERSSPSSLKTPTSCGSITESTSLQPDPATTKPQVAAPTTVLTVLELTSQPSQTVVAPTLAGLHSATTATATSSPTVLRLVAAAMTPTAAAATAVAPTMELTGGPVAAAVAVAEATRTACLRRLTGRLRRSPEDRGAAAEEVDHRS